MKKVKKFLAILLFVNIVILLGYMNKFEARADFISDMENQSSKFISAGASGASDSGSTAQVIKSVTGNFTGLGQLLTMIGAGVMVIVVSYMGIKYLISPPDKQAALKQQLIGVLVAGIVIFGAYGIWSAVIGVVSKF